MNNITETLVTIASLIVGVALLSVIVSRKSNTTGVIQAMGSAFSNALSTATSPVTGVGGAANLSYPSSSALGSLSIGGF